MKPEQTADTFLGFDASLKFPLIFSSGLHLIVFILTAVGLPFVVNEPTITNIPITIEVVERTKEAKTPKPAPPKPKPMPMPKMTEEAPPDLTKIEPKPEEIKEDKKEITPEAIPDPDKKTKEKPKEDTKKPEPEATKVEKKEPKKDFASLLKNLTPDVEEDQKPVPELEKTIEEIMEEAQLSAIGDKISMSELDSLKHQLGQCWNVNTGAKYAENLIVEVRVIVNPDRTVKRATILNEARYNRDTAYRAAAESALRALRNPRCSPLELPPEKYEEWKTTVIIFDPSEML
ncbi:energy transducer TonB [Alphaproteobacteria bacterium]|nr:energy transducer TonB [Alphaproteobacteria bacterium]